MPSASAKTTCDLGVSGGCTVHNGLFCSRLPQDCRRKLAALARVWSYPRGTRILEQEGRSDLVGNVIDGVLKMLRSQPDGGEQIVGLLMPTDFFGRLYSEEVDFTVEAATDATLCTYDRRRFEALMAEYPALEHEVMLSVLTELDAAREWIGLLGRRTVFEKFACFLLILCRRWPFLGCGLAADRRRLEIVVPIRRADLALYLGTTAETISRTAQAMVRSGVLRVITPSRFEVLDLDALVDLAGETEFDGRRILDAMSKAS